MTAMLSYTLSEGEYGRYIIYVGNMEEDFPYTYKVRTFLSRLAGLVRVDSTSLSRDPRVVGICVAWGEGFPASTPRVLLVAFEDVVWHLMDIISEGETKRTGCPRGMNGMAW